MLIIYQIFPVTAKKCQDQKNKDYTTNYFLKERILRKLGRPMEWETLEKYVSYNVSRNIFPNIYSVEHLPMAASVVVI